MAKQVILDSFSPDMLLLAGQMAPEIPREVDIDGTWSPYGIPQATVSFTSPQKIKKSDYYLQFKTLSMIKAMYGIRPVDLLGVAPSQPRAEHLGGEAIDLISIRKKSPCVCYSLVFLSASYLLEDSSAGKQHLGHISKQGNSLLRFLLVEAAQAAARVHPDWRRRYRHLAMRRHKSIAKVAMGRRLAIRLYWMWRNGCEYSQSLEFGSYAGQLGTGHGVK